MNRAADVALASVGIVLTSPLLAAGALAVKFQDGGPVFYRQRRVGKDGTEFELLKLRTMVVGAEKLGAGYAVDRGDPRITRTGRLLRRLSIDELPQLWNVVRGEMSVIGPRPTLRYQVEQYDERQQHRLDVKPGITGWAQVNGRAELPWADRIELDVWYVEHRSLRLDLRILAKTPGALLGGAGSVARDPYAGSSADSPLRQAAERERAGAVPPVPRRPGRRRLRAPQAEDDGGRGGEARRRLRRGQG